MSDKRQVVDSKGVPAPSNCFRPFNNPFLFVIPTEANPDFLQRRKSGVAEGRDLRCAIRMPTFTVLHHFLLCHRGGTGRTVP
jgi:hypothetical protein